MSSSQEATTYEQQHRSSNEGDEHLDEQKQQQQQQQQRPRRRNSIVKTNNTTNKISNKRGSNPDDFMEVYHPDDNNNKPKRNNTTTTTSSSSYRRKSSSGYKRRASNELAASVRLDQLRMLQKQLSVMIHDAKDDQEDNIANVAGGGLDSSMHSHASSVLSGTSSASPSSNFVQRTIQGGYNNINHNRGSDDGGPSWIPSTSRRGSTADSIYSEQSSLLTTNTPPIGGGEEHDLEAGGRGGLMMHHHDEEIPSSLPHTAYRPPRRKESQQSQFDVSEDTLLVTHRTNNGSRGSGGGGGVLKPSIIKASSTLPDRYPSEVESNISSSVHSSSVTGGSGGGGYLNDIEEGRSNASSLTQPTLGTNGTDGSTQPVKDNKKGERKSRWSRATSRSPARSISRSLSRARNRSSSRSRRSIFGKTNNTKQTHQDIMLSTSDRSGRPVTSRRSGNLLHEYDFLTAEEKKQDQEGGSLRPGAKWWHGVFLFSLISMLACIITLWAPYPIGARMPTEQIATMPWSTGCKDGLQSCICPRETICADDLLSMIFLTIARSTAWFDYPLYMLLFMSKANNLNNFLQKTALRCWINFSDYHRVHSLFGIIVGIESTSHTFFHVLRWARRNNDIQLLLHSTTGITGLIAIILTPFIVLPMTVPYLKSRMRFEWRKALHYLCIVWGAALMCHAPNRIFWLIGIPVFVYTADKMVEAFFKTHLVESAHFQRLGDTSCIISFENPTGFGKQNSAYVYLMLPWLSKYQFHAFTVFPCTKPNHSSICIHKCGDWTEKLMKTITTPTHKPAFVVGPFLSPFSSPAMDSEHLVAVASGIGVTPAISLIKQYSSTSRRLNLVWICRDAGLVEHFLQNVEFGSDGYTLIYYTGKDRSIILTDDLPPNVFIFNGRPNLERAISGIISSIATGEGLPEELQKKVVTRTPAEMRSKLLLEKALSIYSMDQLYDYTVKASNHYNEGLEPLINKVNYQGVLSTMRHLLGEDCELVTDRITRNFEKINTNGDCRMDREEFEDFFNLMLSDTDPTQQEDVASIKRGLQRMSTARDMFESGRGGPKSLDSENKDEFGIKKHLYGDGKFSAQNWNMLYCGGSQPVLDQLKAFKRKFGIGLSVEKFDW